MSKTIENLKKLKSFYNGSYGVDIDKAIKALEQESRWIPISERLPKKNVEVLATTVLDDVTIAEMYSENDWFINDGFGNAETDEIVAWMPLPEPYTESEDKE